MKRRIIFATANSGKMKEVRMILEDLGCEILSMEEAGAGQDIIEDGETFAENAEIKAKAIWDCTGDIVLADDSGLAVDYLNGEPGVYSARFLGEDTPYDVKNRELISLLRDAKESQRTARFVCNIAAVLPDGTVRHTESTMEGTIAHEPSGAGGFGYDPILFLPQYGKTSAQLTIEEKNQISHRGKALEAMKAELRKVIEGGC